MDPDRPDHEEHQPESMSPKKSGPTEPYAVSGGPEPGPSPEPLTDTAASSVSEPVRSPRAESDRAEPERPGAGSGNGWVWGWLVALVGWSVVLAFYGIQSGAEFEPTDAWVGQTAREMLEADEWIVPRFSGELRAQKSPGPYWAVMAVSVVRGQPVDKFAVRFPNAVFAVLLVVTIFWLTRAIGGDRAAVFAGFAAASSPLLVYWSHRGASDLGLATLCAISLACFWQAIHSTSTNRGRVALWLLGYSAAGLGMLYKMPMPVVCVGIPMFLYVLLRNQWRHLRSGWHLVGLGLFLLPWLPWAITLLFVEPTILAKWKMEFWARFTGDLPNVREQQQWYFYLSYIGATALYSLPYTLSVPSALLGGLRRQRGVSRDGSVFLLAWFVGLFAFFTIAAGKEWRYFLPAMPPVFVLLGIELARLFDPGRLVHPRRVQHATLLVWVLVPLGFAAGAYGVYYKVQYDGAFAWSEVWPAYVGVALIFCLGTGLAAWFYRRRRRNLSFGTIVGTVWVMWLWAWPMFIPYFTAERPFVVFAEALRHRVPHEHRSHLVMVGSQDPRIIWYSDVRIPRIIDQLELLEAQGGRRNLERERHLVGLAMGRALAADDPVLMIASRLHYVDYLINAPEVLADEPELSFVRPHLWLQTPPHYARSRHFVVFGNQPPPWPEPDLEPPSQRLSAAATTQPRSEP